MESKDFIKSAATDFLENKALGIAADFKDMLDKLSPKQKEFAYNMAIIKAADVSELNMDEVIELGEVLNKASELNIEIAGDVSEFWDRIGGLAKETAMKFGEFGIKMAARALVGFLPII